MTTQSPARPRLSLLVADAAGAPRPQTMRKKPPLTADTTPANDAGPAAVATTKKSKAARALPIVNAAVSAAVIGDDDSALQATWPEAVMVLSDGERARRVRRGLDTVLLDEVGDDGRRRTRGFVRAVLRVPLDHPKARVYGVFVEVDRDGYAALRRAFQEKAPARVHGRLATRLPFLDDAYGTGVWLIEDGSDRRARIVDVDSPLLRDGPTIGPRRVRLGPSSG